MNLHRERSARLRRMPKRSKLDLEKMRASLSTQCPHCGHSITPADTTGIEIKFCMIADRTQVKKFSGALLVRAASRLCAQDIWNLRLPVIQPQIGKVRASSFPNLR